MRIPRGACSREVDEEVAQDASTSHGFSFGAPIVNCFSSCWNAISSS
jgi:hypothetical protein